MTPQEIAAGLTKAQRAAVLRALWHEHASILHPEGLYVGADKRVRRGLAKQGLTRDYVAYFQRLTPLGQQVRAILEQQHDT